MSPARFRYQTPGDPDDHNDPPPVFTDVDTVCVFQQKNAPGLAGDVGEVSAETWTAWFGPDEALPGVGDQLIDGETFVFRGRHHRGPQPGRRA